MSVPGIIEDRLEGESVTARVSLGGDDELFVTPTRTLVYRGEGLLRDESVDEYDHDVERLSLSEGRRKTTISLEYPIDGTRELTLPSDGADNALTPLLEGVLTAWEVIDADESVIAAYRFSELTLVIAERRLVKHVGSGLLDEGIEEFRYTDVTDLEFEEGSVATQIVLTVGGRQERIKAPSDRAAEVRKRLENALWDFYDVASTEELRRVISREETATESDETEDDGGEEGESVGFGESVDPLGATPAASESESGDGTATTSAEAEAESVREEVANEQEAESTADAGDEFESTGFEPAETREDDLEDLRAEVTKLREAVDRQNDLLAKQQETIEQLIEELSRGR